jgi:superfamily II DNA or RNA helicase
LLFQAIDDFNEYQKHLPDDDKLKMYLIGGNAKNSIRMQDANVIVGTYQSLVDIPEEQFDNIATVIADEGHTSKALSVASVIKKCSKAELVTAISGTMAYMDPVDALTIESYCGPMILSYPVWQQIEKGRLPKVAIQPIRLTHSVSHGVIYNALLSTERLPKPSVGMDPDKAALYRNLEMKYLAFNENMINYLFTLTEQITKQGKNILIVFKNVMPCINAFEYFKEHGQKTHLIIGATPTFTRKEIIGQIESEVGWALVATDGTMSMGVSIKNFHAMVVCMIGKSPHVTLQAVGRMLRNHASKDETTYVYDIFNDLHEFGGTSFDQYNFRERQHFYKNEQYHVLKVHDRTI